MKVPAILEQQLQQSALPDPQARPLVDPAAGAVGQGLQELGQNIEGATDQVARVQARAKRRADEIAVTNQETQYEHDWTTASLGNRGGTDSSAPGGAGGPSAAPLVSADDGSVLGPPTGPSSKAVEALGDDTSGLSPKGLFNEQGMAAAKYSHTTYDWMAQRRDELAAGLQNPEQKQLFLERTGQRLEGYRAQIERHTSQQIDVAENQTLQARMAAGSDAIGREISAPGMKDTDIEYSLDSNVAEVADRIKALHPGEVGDQQAQAYKEQETTKVLQHYLDAKDARGAQNFFDRRREDLGKNADQLGKAVKTLTIGQGAEDAANGLLSDAKNEGGLYDMAKFSSGVIEKSRGMEKDQADAFDAAARRGQSFASESNRALTENNFNDALSAYQKNFNINAISPTTSAWMQKYDPKGWKSILDEDAHHQAELRAQAHGQKVEESPEDLARFYEFKDSIGDLSPDELASAKPGSVISSAVKMGIPLKRAGELSDYLLKLKHDPNAANAGLTPSQSDVIKDELISAGFGENHNGVMRIKASALPLRTKLEQEVLKQQTSLRAASTTKDKKYTLEGDDLRKFLGPAIAPVVTETHWYKADDTKPAIETPGYRSQVVPQQDADQISAALKQSGEEVTPAKIRQVYESHPGKPAPASAPSSGAAPVGNTVKIEDLAKDPTQASMLEPAARSAIARLSGRPGEPDFVPVQPRASLKAPARQKIVLPEMHLTGKPKQAETSLDVMKNTVAEETSGVDDAIKGNQ